MTDRFARINHGYSGADCSTFVMVEKPQQCRMGSQDAQNLSAMASFISNSFTFLTSALVGSISDHNGRRGKMQLYSSLTLFYYLNCSRSKHTMIRCIFLYHPPSLTLDRPGILVLGMFLSLLSPLFLVIVQTNDKMNPLWYYIASSTTGLISWFAVAISALSDVTPPKWRAPSFGLLLASFMFGFALSPLLAIAFDHKAISFISFSMYLGVFIFAVLFLPETLPLAVRQESIREMEEKCSNHTFRKKLVSLLTRPFRELSILNRSYLFRLLSSLAFFSGMVSSADQSLLIYYAEDQLNFNDSDVAKMIAMIGVLGIVVQGAIIKPLNECIGERRVVMVAFTFGAIHNVFYGLATTKFELFIGNALGSLVSMSFPTISAMKSNNVGECEQGRVQGALYSLSALASAVGPASLRIVYHATRDSDLPGFMFLFASILYVIAVVCAYALPPELSDTRAQKNPNLETCEEAMLPESCYGSLHSLEEPLIEC